MTKYATKTQWFIIELVPQKDYKLHKKKQNTTDNK